MADKRRFVRPSEDDHRRICYRFIRKSNVFYLPVSWNNGRISQKNHCCFLLLQTPTFRDVTCTCFTVAGWSFRVHRRRPTCVDWIRFATINRRWVQERRGSIRTRSIRVSYCCAPRKTKFAKSIPKNSSIWVIVSWNEGAFEILRSGIYFCRTNPLGVSTRRRKAFAIVKR